MASMRDLAMQLVNNVAQGFRLDKGEADSYLEVMDRSPYGTGAPLSVGYGENEMSPIDMSAIVTGMVPVLGDVTGLAADVDMYMRDPESRNMPNYLLTAAGALPFIPAASQVRKGIKAYHGSPHEFDKFSTEQIGTGEGAQAYGQGLYFTETEDVAKGYKGSTNYADKRRRFQKELPDDADVEEVMELVEEGVFSDDLNELLMALEADDWLGFDYPSQAISASLSGKLKNYDPSPRLIKATESGSMYEVNIDVAPDELLDWDKPLSDQKGLLQKIDDVYGDHDIVLQQLGLDLRDNPTGMDLADALNMRRGTASGPPKILEEAGIKGVRYADAFTRHKTPDKRSMNYVIFDDRLISISKKYGIAIPVAAALLAKQTGEDTSQSYEEI
tara:strand:+ start:3329 stop:4489 length:1161 start_codon:yes stop_codon:yes gene_type:complete